MRHTLLTRALILTALPAAILGCAGGGPTEEVAERTTPVGADCFTVSLARNFRHLDDHNLIVYAAGREPYHVELSQACFGLRGDFAIALRSRTDRMCGFAGDSVIVRGAGFPERCSVVSVRRLDEEQMQLLVDQYNAEDREDVPIEVEVAELPEDEAEAAGEDGDASDAEAGGADAEADAEPDGADSETDAEPARNDPADEDPDVRSD